MLENLYFLNTFNYVKDSIDSGLTNSITELRNNFNDDNIITVSEKKTYHLPCNLNFIPVYRRPCRTFSVI